MKGWSSEPSRNASFSGMADTTVNADDGHSGSGFHDVRLERKAGYSGDVEMARSRKRPSVILIFGEQLDLRVAASTTHLGTALARLVRLLCPLPATHEHLPHNRIPGYRATPLRSSEICGNTSGPFADHTASSPKCTFSPVRNPRSLPEHCSYRAVEA